MDLYIQEVSVNGNRYKLQHPGNRIVLQLRARCTDPQTGAADLESLLDYCFEHMVFPIGHKFKPTVDNLPPKEFEEWLAILPRYLRLGYVEQPGTAAKGTEQSEKAG